MEYQILRQYVFEHYAISLERSTAALHKWRVRISNCRHPERYDQAREFTEERAAWQEFYGKCMAELENESAIWHNHDAEAEVK